MRKNVKHSIVSLILCAAMSCVIGAFALMSPFKAKADATSAYYTLEGFNIEETAAVRSVEPNGIRFTTQLSDETKTAIDGLGLSDVSYGTLLLPADFLGTEELTHGTAKVVDVPTKTWQDEGQTKYTSVLVGKANGDGTYQNLPESYYNRPIAARSYVTGTTEDGQQVTYYSKNTAVRSIGYVAYMAKLDGNDSELINDIVSKTEIKLTFGSTRISALQNSTEGTTVVENSIEQSTTKAATVMVGGIPVPADKVGTITYTSEATEVISVDGETLTAIKEGSATITASVTFGGIELTAVKEMSTDCYEAKTAYQILISENAAAAQLNANTTYLPAQSEEAYNAYHLAYEKTAAYKLQSVLKEATGVELPIVTSVETGVKYISVGETALASNVSVSGLKETEAKVQVVDGNVIIRGGGQEGTLYGVQRWLYDTVGYEYYMNNTYVINDKVEIVAFNEAHTYTRDIAYNVTQTSRLDKEGSLDEYGMRSYTETIIPVGITTEEESNGYYYKGIAHNSVAVVTGDGFVKDVAATDVSGNTGTITKTYWSGKLGTAYSLSDDSYAAYFADNGAATTNTYKDWYATYTKTYQYGTKGLMSSSISWSTKTAGQFYHMIKNPSYDSEAEEGTFESYQYIKAELCYTAHGDSTQKAAMVEVVASAMYTQMQKFPLYDRIAFSQADHTIWCECDACAAQGNAADNLLEFLLDVAASLETKLAEAGDARASTFKITTLFYHKSNVVPANTANYTDKLSSYMKHMEVWFAETGADQIDAYELTDEEKTAISSANNGNDWNATIFEHLTDWYTICKKYGADMLWWGYYANTTSSFIPFNTINALRRNYATAYDKEVDYMFNQMMEFQTNWSSLKYYLMSKLTVNANPTDEIWNGWMDSYFKGSYGQGAEYMQDYFELWDTWTTNNADAYRREYTYAEYQNGTKSSTAAMAVDAREWSTLLTTTELESWIAAIDNALAALDKADANYETYYRNIMLEKLVPMYLLMWIHDGYTPVTDSVNLSWPYIDVSQPGSFTSDTYVSKYGAEFLTWIADWGMTYDGEGTQRVLAPFLTAIGNKGEAAYTQVVVSDLILAEVGETVTLTNSTLTAGDYTVSGTLTTVESATVSTDGEITISVSGDLTVGDIYVVTFTNQTTGSSVIFNNVMVASSILAEDAGAVEGSNGYYIIDKTYYIEEGTTDTWLTHNVLQKGAYTVTVNGNSTESTVYYTGKLKVTLSNMLNGTQCKVIVVDSNSNTYVFNVVGATYIRTVEELQELGVGGGVETTGSLRDFGGRGNSFKAGNDVTGYYVLANDLNAAGYYFAAGYFGYKSYFRGTFDGNGYTIYNAIFSEGGIFGGISGATIRNVNFVNAEYHGNGASLPSTTTSNLSGQGYNNTTQYGQQMGLFAQFAASSTIENVNVQVTALQTTGAHGHVSGLIVYSTSGGGNLFRNITIDASGLVINNALGRELTDKVTFSNVIIKGASCSIIGYADSGVTALTEWPSGVTFESVDSLNNNYVTLVGDSGVAGTGLPIYTGDVTALGFEEGTVVQYAVQDNRSDMWSAGTNLGLTMEKQGVRLVKDLEEEYASVQFSISRAFTGTYAFFTWWYNSEGTNKGGGGYLKADGTYYASGTTMSNPNACAFDLETGEIATSFVPGKVYELRWYSNEAIVFKLGCCEANGEPITIYYANRSSGDEDILTDSVTVEINESVTTTQDGTTATATFTTTGTTTLDVSDVTAIVGSKPVTMWLNGDVIYEGTLEDTLTLDVSLFANSDNNVVLIRYDGGCVHLPISVSRNIKLNQENAGSVYKLQAILATQPGGNYVLTSNLDMGGSALKGIETFSGVLDGNGYVITNTSLAYGANPSIAGYSYAPLFIVTNNGTLKNLGFELSSYVWNAGSQERGITVKNYGTISNVYVTITLKTELNGKDGYTPTSGADVSTYNAVGVLGKYNYGTVENSIVSVTSDVELSNYCVAALFYKNTSAGIVKNSYVITDVEVIEPVWDQSGTSTNVTKCADWSVVNTSSMTSSNGWSDVWSVDDEGCLYFGSILLYEPTTSTPTVSATDNADELTVYDGAASDLGFNTTSTVYQAQISNGWSSRVLITTDNVNADYVMFDFAVSNAISGIIVWPYDSGTTFGSYSINAAGVNINDGNADARTIVIYDANGNDVSTGPWAANTAYTMVVCLKGATKTIDSFAVSSFNSPGNFYFTNLKSGYITDLGEIIDVSTGEFTLPSSVSGTATAVSFAGANILSSASDSTVVLDVDAVTTDSTKLGKDKLVYVITNNGRYLLNATVVTKVIKTADDIFNLGVGGKSGTGLIQNSDVAGNDVLGYYLVADDIDCGGTLFAAGYNYQKSYFKGVFDGNGKTISNFKFGSGGIFGGMNYATVKNVNFESVTMNGGTNDDGFWSNYTALFAHIAYRSTFEDINVEIVTINTARRNFPILDGLLVQGVKSYSTFRNIVVDATDLTVENALGTDIGSSTNLTYENVIIYAGDVTRIGYVGAEQVKIAGTDEDGDGNDDATGNALTDGYYTTEAEYLTEWPTGVTVVKKLTNTALQYKKGGDVPVYDGSVTDLGFAEGTTVYRYTAPAATTDDIWTVMGNNGILLTKATYEDYASVQFVLGRDFANTSTSAGAFFSWIHVLPDNATSVVYAAGGWLYRNGATGASSETKFPANQNGFEFVVYEADGDLVTASNPLVAGQVYTLYVYCDYLVDIELCVYATSGEEMDVYFANASSGNVKTATMDEVIDISAGEFTLPDSVEGTVLSVSFNGKGILSSAEGNTVVFNQSAMPTEAADLGAGKTLVVVTDKGYYEVEATVVSQIITTAEELQALGVGGRTLTSTDETTGETTYTYVGNANSDVSGNNKTGYYLLGNDVDASGLYLAAGYSRSASYFKGVFDGNGHTVYNVVASEGGIFGGLYGATIKNVNFANVEYHGNGASGIGAGYNNNEQWGQYYGLFAHTATNTTITDVNIQVSKINASGTYGNNGGALVYNTKNGGNVFSKINIDASGLTFNNVLGAYQTGVTYSDVTVKLAGYTTAIGYSDGSTALEEWPSGITPVTVAEHPNSYVIWHNSKAYVSNTEILPFYSGDVTALGFAEGTLVQYAVQDIRTSAWSAGTTLGLTMEQQVIRLTKTADEDYASVQFALSRDMTASNIFFAWCYDADGNNTNVSVSKSKGTGTATNATTSVTITVKVLNLDGTQATNIVAGKAYEMRWYAEGEYRFQIGCYEADGNPITVYYANPYSGSDPVVGGVAPSSVDSALTLTPVVFDESVNAYKVTATSQGKVYMDTTLLANKSTFTFTAYVSEIVDSTAYMLRIKPNELTGNITGTSNGYIYYTPSVVTVGSWQTFTVDISSFGESCTEFSFVIPAGQTVWLRDITIE